MIYTYKCSACGSVFDASVPIGGRNDPQPCACGKTGERSLSHELQGKGRFNALMQDHERWSKAMGVNPETIPEAMRRFPDRTYNAEGDLLVKNRAHKVRLMRENGVTEFD